MSFHSGDMHQEPEKRKAAHRGGIPGRLGSEHQFRASSVFALKAPWRLLPGCRILVNPESLLMLWRCYTYSGLEINQIQ
jgi:hypothetical protein